MADLAEHETQQLGHPPGLRKNGPYFFSSPQTLAQPIVPPFCMSTCLLRMRSMQMMLMQMKLMQMKLMQMKLMCTATYAQQL
jgi:hypothetical protein